MKISLKSLYSGGACWRLDYDNGKTEYVIGLKQIKRIINKPAEKIDLEKSLGFQEHSELIKLLGNKK